MAHMLSIIFRTKVLWSERIVYIGRYATSITMNSKFLFSSPMFSLQAAHVVQSVTGRVRIDIDIKVTLIWIKIDIDIKVTLIEIIIDIDIKEM